jgi:AP2 domain.
LKWREKRGGRANAGSWAGWLSKQDDCGKLRKDWHITIDGHKYIASRIIYFMHHGVDPYPMEVDHEDRNSLNNNVDNLRLGSSVLQSQNRTIRSDNTSGVKGVNWNKQTSKWVARIRIDKKEIWLGRFTTLKEAAEARNAAVREYWPEEVWGANLINIEAL